MIHALLKQWPCGRRRTRCSQTLQHKIRHYYAAGAKFLRMFVCTARCANRLAYKLQSLQAESEMNQFQHEHLSVILDCHSLKFMFNFFIDTWFRLFAH